MKSLHLLILSFLFISGCKPSPTDDEKLNELNIRCKKFSTEIIKDNSADEDVLISTYFEPLVEDGKNTHKIDSLKVGSSSEVEAPIGSAKLPVLDMEYHPNYLLRSLLEGNDKLTRVIFPTNPYKRLKYNECLPNKYIYIHDSDEAKKAISGICKKEQEFGFSDEHRVLVTSAYGKPDSYDIRPFIFKVTGRNGHILAEQKSYQLLLGGMSNKENRVLLAWGGAQSVKNCNLTPPDQVVKRIVR